MLKRLILSGSVVLVTLIVVLAFIPHYGCACASNEGIVKYDGSWLSHIVRQIIP